MTVGTQERKILTAVVLSITIAVMEFQRYGFTRPGSSFAALTNSSSPALLKQPLK